LKNPPIRCGRGYRQADAGRQQLALPAAGDEQSPFASSPTSIGPNGPVDEKAPAGERRVEADARGPLGAAREQEAEEQRKPSDMPRSGPSPQEGALEVGLRNGISRSGWMSKSKWNLHPYLQRLDGSRYPMVPYVSSSAALWVDR